MITKIEKIDFDNLELNNKIFEKAAEIIKNGGLVAFPTETVYGLGANGLDSTAVKKIYSAKGRPSDNPLIIHIAQMDSIKPLVKSIPEKAQLLMEAFWPGPLTIIFEKTDIIPLETSGGLDSVAIRFPSNSTAQSFINACGLPIAAPSANTSGRPSPTHASHVAFDLKGRVNMIIDGGHCEYGVESTIVDVSSGEPRLLRPGSITLSMLEDVVGTIDVDKSVVSKLSSDETPKAPGMKYTHYSPTANVVIVSGTLENVTEKIKELAAQSIKRGIQTCIIATEQTKNKYDGFEVLVIGDRNKPETIAANLFKILRKCDYLNMSQVYAEAFDESDVGLAIMNRLKRASGYNIIKA